MPIFALLNDSFSNASLATLTLGLFSPMVTNLLIGVFLVICIVMILVVLIQRPQGGGLSGAFGSGGTGGGGGGAGQTAFGTKTGDVLTWATITVFVLFLLFAIVLNFATRPQVARVSQPIMTLPVGEVEPIDLPADASDDDLNEDPIDLSGTPANSENLLEPTPEAALETTPQTAPAEDE